MLHGFSPRLANQVLDDAPIPFPNRIDGTASDLLIGRSEDGRFWTIAIRDTEEAEVWRIVTGYESNQQEVALYLKWLGKPLKSRDHRE